MDPTNSVAIQTQIQKYHYSELWTLLLRQNPSCTLKFRISNKSYGVTVECLCLVALYFFFIILRIEFALYNFDILHFLKFDWYFMLMKFQLGFKI